MFGKNGNGSGYITDNKVREGNLIGEGAFAKVYTVTEPGTGRIQACKVSRERELLRKEAFILKKVNHPLFPRFYDYREKGEWGFLYMEYVPGKTLKKVVTERGKLTQKQTVQIAAELADGLLYLHEQTLPILFRDLKPENIIMEQEGRVKLVDFGSADVGEAFRKVITGTKGYGAPEQWWDFMRVDKCSDVYALGKVMYFMLGNQKRAKWLEDLLEDCVSTKTEERIPDMRCFLARLRGKKWGKGRFLYQQNILR